MALLTPLAALEAELAAFPTAVIELTGRLLAVLTVVVTLDLAGVGPGWAVDA